MYSIRSSTPLIARLAPLCIGSRRFPWMAAAIYPPSLSRAHKSRDESLQGTQHGGFGILSLCIVSVYVHPLLKVITYI